MFSRSGRGSSSDNRIAPVSSSDRDLSDERSLRERAENRLAAETENAQLWRKRAEERASRITALENRIEGLKRLPEPLRWIRRPRRGQASEPGPTKRSTSPPKWPSLPSVTVAAIVDGQPIRPILDEATVVDPLEETGALDRADLVLIDSQGWAAADSSSRDRLSQMLEHPGRPPLIFWSDGSALPDVARLADARLTFDPADEAVPFLPASYQPGLPTSDGTGRQLHALQKPAAISIAAAGRSLAFDGEFQSDLDAARRQARRWAFRHHRPGLRLTQLLDRAGVSYPEPGPRVAAILVSNRPDLVGHALQRLGAQTWRPLEIIVGLHGFSDPGLHSPAGDVELRVFELNEALTLGECLNHVISQSTADVMAKIDDDDHYGPAYFEDALADMEDSGSAVVGKASVFTYLATEDTTVIRRPGNELTEIGGTLGGNTMVFRRSLWEQVPFPHRPRFVDTILLQAAVRLGHRIYSGSRFEFCAVRHGTGHTYGASDRLMASGSEAAWEGLHPERAFLPDLETLIH